MNRALPVSLAIRFVKEWRSRMPGFIERGFDYGTAATLVSRNIAEWLPEEKAPVIPAITETSQPVPQAQQQPKRKK